MSKPIRFGSAISLVALATVMAGCASPQHHAASASSQPSGEVGLATRALAALANNDSATAINYAEQAAARTPADATIRALLGNAYFAGGRFSSAETAFKDSLSINPAQSQVVLKLALAEIAQGKNDQALAVLNASRGSLDPADYGLALALAGRPTAAVDVLETVARAAGADARVRQNLALSHALAGDWVSARTIAAQDVPADQLEGRIQQWMQIANPAKPGEQLAALIGVKPVAADPGEPVQLALVKPDAQLAQVAPAPVAAAPQDVPQLAQAVPPPLPPMEAAPGDAPVASPSVDAPAAPAFTPEISAPPPPPALKPARVVHAAFPKVVARKAGNSGAVVQIGSYSNAARVAAAWNAAAHRYGGLRNYSPMSARFDSGKGTFYRLSVKGFGSVGEANALCSSIRRGGGSCFVRGTAGDRPVELASR
jgi:Flp pilus assembly protein TadD